MYVCYIIMYCENNNFLWEIIYKGFRFLQFRLSYWNLEWAVLKYHNLCDFSLQFTCKQKLWHLYDYAQEENGALWKSHKVWTSIFIGR